VPEVIDPVRLRGVNDLGVYRFVFTGSRQSDAAWALGGAGFQGTRRGLYLRWERSSSAAGLSAIASVWQRKSRLLLQEVVHRLAEAQRDALSPHELEHLEETWTDSSAGDRHTGRVNQGRGFHTP
jgi:hypothetical protein